MTTCLSENSSMESASQLDKPFLMVKEAIKVEILIRDLAKVIETSEKGSPQRRAARAFADAF